MNAYDEWDNSAAEQPVNIHDDLVEALIQQGKLRLPDAQDSAVRSQTAL